MKRIPFVISFAKQIKSCSVRVDTKFSYFDCVFNRLFSNKIFRFPPLQYSVIINVGSKIKRIYDLFKKDDTFDGTIAKAMFWEGF